ncbi:hypothetical protein LJ707_06360 [Mucilaginibacter sp. UR6-1]|uniref:hypothetical protein n=1 Tax=Mucilaginibacter sp. UR6-1 TaxID=1435643 RepID=UPI001E4E1BC0|nr:hypothetical protein [Mucilaginibacter sp. UR6-1]MCC8408546.1 hypothetical protein [Mucilaginibacter sp. UR6-1]
MITIYYKAGSHDVTGWKERLDRISLKYDFIDDHDTTTPRLVDGEKQVEGIKAIDDYIESQEQFVNGWYEDRCDRYDFDPDAPVKIRGINQDE